MTVRVPRLDLRVQEHSLLAMAWPWLAAGAFTFAVYVCTLAPTVFSLDSPELTAAAYTLGIPHAPGYPVYLLLAHLFTRLPLGDVGYRVNLFSALAGAGMVTLVTALVERLTRRPFPSLAAGLSLGLSYYAWSVAVVAEVYALQGMLLAGLLLALWGWRQNGRRRDLFLAAGLGGLALANNPASALWWPGLLVLAWATPHRRRLTRGEKLALAGTFLLALAPVLYLPLRSAARPPFVYVGQYDADGTFHPLDLTRPTALVWYLAGGQFENLVMAYSARGFLVEGAWFLYRLWAAFLGVGLPLGLWGGWVLWRRDRRLAAGLVVTALPHALFFIGYRAVDKEMMFLPVYLTWAILLGVGLGQMEGMLRPRVAVGLLPLALLLVNLPYADVSDFWLPAERARARLTGAALNALYVASWGDAAAMHYLQVVEGLRPDVTVVNRFFAPPDVLMSLVQRAALSGRDVYLLHPEPALRARYRLIFTPRGYRLVHKWRLQ